MEKLLALALSAFISVSNAWGSSPVNDKVEEIFSPSIIGSIKENKRECEITFKIPDRDPTYFSSGDKANKVFAIESARLFRDAPELTRLKMKIPANGKKYSIDISRNDVEKFYGVSLSSMNGNPDAWRNDFMQKFDNKESRSAFVKKFVTQE